MQKKMILARQIGSDRHVLLHEDEAMSMGYTDPMTVVEADSVVLAAYDLLHALECWIEEEEGKGRSGTITAYEAIRKAKNTI